MDNLKNQRLNVEIKSNLKKSISDLTNETEPFIEKSVEQHSDSIFLENARRFVDLILISKGDIKLIEKEFPVTSFAIEFIEKAKTICRKKQLLFQEKVLNTVKDSIYTSRKLSLLQATVIFFMNDLIFLNEKGELEEDESAELQDYFNELKINFKADYKEGEW